MFKVSEVFNKEINKLQGRKFNAKVIIRDKEYSGNQIYEMNLEESVNPSDSFSIGSICSNSFDIKLINTGDIFDNAIVKPYVGLYIGDDIEYIPLGVFTVIKTSVKGKFINLECVDNMLGLEKVYFSDLSYPADINDIAKEICKKAGVNLASKLPNYRVNKIEGYSLREAIGFIASLCGSFARFNRIGDLEVRDYEVVKQEMTPHNLFKLDIEANQCIIKKVIAKKGEEELSTGTDDGNKIVFNNPIITKEILSDIYTKYNGFKYIPYTAKWKGNPAIMAGDILNLTDLNGNKYNALIMEQKFTYKNGISSEVKAKGKTRQDSSFDSKGSVAQSMERYSIEQANIKKALIDKASINDLTAVDAKIQRLYTDDLTAIRADIVTLNSKKANIVELNSIKADLQQAIIGKANITDLNAAVGKINVLESKTASIENALNKNLTAENIATGAITAGSGIIAEGAIGDAEISSLSVNKLKVGDITTSKHRIVSADGTIEIVGNQILINRNNVNRVILGEYRKSDGTTEYGLLVRAKDGQTIMLDGNGVHNAGITDGAIDNNKVADNANISGNKLDINSVIREVNTSGTETIKGTKVVVGDRTLDVELSIQKNTITEHSKELFSQKASLTALDNAIKLKVDSQTFTQSTTTINNNINRAKEEAINSANSHANSKANEALNNAKAFVNSEITNVNTHLNKNTSEINILKGQIESKVSQSDIDKSIQNIKFNDVNMISNSGEFKGTDHWSCTNGSNNLTIENSILKFKFTNYANWGCYISNDSLRNKPLETSKEYTVVCRLKASRNQTLSFNICDGDSNNHVYARDLNITTEWKIFKFTFKPASIGNERQFRFITGNLGYDFDFYIEFVKMVEGATSSDSWSMAPDYVLDNIKTVTDKITTVESKLTQENNSIKASVQDLNSTTQTITTNVSNIDRDLTSKINSNLDAAKSFATDIAIAKANLAKEQAIANADGKITAEEQKRIQQAQDNLNAAISKATEAEIKAKSYADVKKQEAINSANNNTANTINNLDIGIYNLANESGNFLDNTGFFVANGGTLEIDSSNTFREYNTLKIKGNSGACYKDYIELQGNTTYCYSCWIKSDRIIPLNVSTPLHMWVTESKEDDVCHREIILKYSKEINSNWQQVFIIFKTPSNKDKYIMKPFIYGIGEATVWLANFQVKKGSILNDWTPNPNDLKRYSEEVAKAKAELAKQQAIANADGKITEEERKRIQQAQENLNVAIARADKAKQEAINSANSHADSKANEALNNAKAYTNAEITTINSKVHNVESGINILKDKINSKVSQSDIDKSISEIKLGGRNLILRSDVELEGTSPKDIQVGKLSDTQFITGKTVTVSLDLEFEDLSGGNRVGYELALAFEDGSTQYIGCWYYVGSSPKTFNGRISSVWNVRQGRIINIHYSGLYIQCNGKRIKIGRPKIELGNKATDWSPAPEDLNQSIADNIKIVDSKISDVSSSVTQLRDSVTTDIRAINSKTQSIETTLNGKASKQEVTEVNNRVATIKASLDSITQRVSSTESKTQTLESNINGKASKQEVNNVSSKVVSLETNLNGITNRVSNTESRINTLDGKVASAVTNQQFTEFKQSNDKFKFTVEQRSSVSNILPNSSFFGGDRGWLHDGVEFWYGSYSGYGFKGRMTGAIKNRTSYNNPERFLQTHKAYKVKKNTTYTISFHYACEMNIHSMEAYVVLSDTEHGDYAQPIRILEKPGGTQSDPNNDIPFTYKFNTGNHEWVWLRFDHNGMKSGTNWDQYCWLYVSEIGIYEGDVGAVKWTPKGGEVYSANYQMDGLGFKGTFEDGTYASLGKDGLEWYNAGTGHAYHALTYVTSFDIPVGNPGKAYIKLPAEFTKRRSSLKWTVALRGYYYSTSGNFFPFHVHCTGARDYIENGLVVCEVQGLCKIQNGSNSGDVQFRPLTAMLIAIA